MYPADVCESPPSRPVSMTRSPPSVLTAPALHRALRVVEEVLPQRFSTAVRPGDIMCEYQERNRQGSWLRRCTCQELEHILDNLCR